MKRGNSAVPFKELGSSPAKVDLTKKPVGPRAEKKKVEKKNPDLSTDISAVPTFSDHMDRALMSKNDRSEPTYEGTDEFRKEKDIPKSEFKEKGVKK